MSNQASHNFNAKSTALLYAFANFSAASGFAL